MAALSPFRHRDPSFSDLVPYAGLVANGVILLKDGSLMAGWYFAGPDSESSKKSGPPSWGAPCQRAGKRRKKSGVLPRSATSQAGGRAAR